MKHFGDRLKKLRKEKGLTQEALAEYLGISYQAVSKWENGLGFPDISLLPALSNFFSTSADYFLGIDLQNSENKIERVLTEARRLAHTGKIGKSIIHIEDALKSFPNDYRLLCDLLEYKVMCPSENAEWLSDIEEKANSILRSCHSDKIRNKTIGSLAFAYSRSGKQEKVAEVTNLLPDFSYSKKRLVSLTVPAKEQAKYKPECIYHEIEVLVFDMLTIAKHHIFWGDPQIAVDVCSRATAIVSSIGTEGYMQCLQVNICINLILAYSKLQRLEDMYLETEKIIDIYKAVEAVISQGETPYTSPLLDGLVISRETMKYGGIVNNLEWYHTFLTEAKILKPHAKDVRFLQLLAKLRYEIETAKQQANVQ